MARSMPVSSSSRQRWFRSPLEHAVDVAHWARDASESAGSLRGEWQRVTHGHDYMRVLTGAGFEDHVLESLRLEL
jgi:hypothetical protein